MKVVKKNKKTRIKFCLLFVAYLVLILSYCFYTLYKFKSTIIYSSAHIPTSRAYVNEVKMVMAGDSLIHGAVYIDARKKDGSYDFKPMIADLKPVVSKYDLAYYNQESILGGSSMPYSNYPRFNSPQEVGDAFVDAGFNLVSLANNHTMDKGEYGVIQSVNYWKNKDGVVYSGQFLSQEDRDEVRIYEKNGIKYAFFSYTTWTNGLNTPRGKDYLNNVYSDEKAKKDILAVRDKVDVVMVAMHWGIEYSFGISDDQKRIANYLSSLGTDLIIGCHPHVVEPIEYINDNKTLVIYSLGNLLSGQIGIERLSGLLAEVTIRKEVSSKGKVKISIIEPRAQLVYTKYSRRYNDFHVYFYNQLNDTILPGYRNYYESYKSIVGSKCPELKWGLSGE